MDALKQQFWGTGMNTTSGIVLQEDEDKIVYKVEKETLLETAEPEKSLEGVNFVWEECVSIRLLKNMLILNLNCTMQISVVFGLVSRS